MSGWRASVIEISFSFVKEAAVASRSFPQDAFAKMQSKIATVSMFAFSSSATLLTALEHSFSIFAISSCSEDTSSCFLLLMEISAGGSMYDVFPDWESPYTNPPNVFLSLALTRTTHLPLRFVIMPSTHVSL